MCGIVGYWRLDGAPADSELIRRMTDQIAHRGPDGDGHFVDGPLALGHRRLAIIDIAGSPQPMTTVDERYVITFNGEIYNYHELREELIARGRKFATRGDTEIILAAYAEWGSDFVRRLRGMFAFAIWDKAERRLFMARDRVGKKPLFYIFSPTLVAFASEMKALLPLPDFDKAIDEQALYDYLTLQYVPDPATIFRSVRKLEPGHWLQVDANGTASSQRYWKLDYADAPESLSEKEWEERTEAAIDEAVRVRLESEVPLGIHLSGGIDSSAVVAFARRHVTGKLRTFSIGFREQGFDETPYARTVAERFETDHEEFVVESEALDILPDLVWHFDEPFADMAALPTWFLSKMTRQHVTVALNGDGGDESFAGYERHRGRGDVNSMRNLPAPIRHKILPPLTNMIGKTFRGSARAEEVAYLGELLAAPDGRYYTQYLTIMRRYQKRQLLQPDVMARIAEKNSGRFMEHYYNEPGIPSDVERRMNCDAHTYLPGALLPKVDHTTMAFGLEARSPFLDHHLMDHAASIPASIKFGNVELKRHLKRVLRGIIPDEVMDRPKKGFSVPLGVWLKGETEKIVHEMLLADDARSRAYFQPEAIERLLRFHLQGKQRNAHRLWILIVFEMWMRRFLVS
ncbi:asparagine synthase (glutamine-hydrolyzing) [bacterium]|nr:asparagine synthase (glutamine-hydrolyzing) [bacterium]